MKSIGNRQVHLDFHTSELMPGVGEQFDKENFQDAVREGNLDSITVFAKCHHSWCYYPTNVGKVHPTLDIDLLGEIIEAAHEIGVRVPIYITVGWSSNDAEEHPDWLARHKDGTIQTANFDVDAKPEDKRPIVSWKCLCPSGEYAEHIYALTEEIANKYDADGIFYDICFIDEVCYCDNCLEGMKAEGFNPDSLEDAKEYYVKMRRDFMSECRAILSKVDPEASMFFNGGAEQYRREYHDLQTHFELEDLPTTWGGYDKMPHRAKFFSRYGKEYLGMTGKFHTMWGEFGGFKSPEALKYECAYMLTYGAKCSVGDQMHPAGFMDLETYKTIGHAYKYVEEIEEYCIGASETTRLGIMLSDEITIVDGKPPVNMSDEGLTKMLLEKQIDFDIVMWDEDFMRFETIILPDTIQLSKDNADKLQQFVDAGGSLILTGDSGLDESGNEFALDIGANFIGKSTYDEDYVECKKEMSEGIVTSPFLFYEAANRVNVVDAVELANIREPYFNRTYATYCSHQNTPYKLEKSDYPAALRKDNIVYLSHKIFKMYYEHGAQYHRDYFINALNLVYKQPVLQVEMPSAGRVRLAEQKEHNRYVLHLLYGSPIQRGRTSVIDDLPPIYDVKVKIKVQTKVTNITLGTTKETVDFVREGDFINFVVPRVRLHEMAIINYL